LFDRGIPVPIAHRPWDFTLAEVGDSLAFDTAAAAAKFARAVRKHNPLWSTKTAPHGGKIRVWIVSKNGWHPPTLPAVAPGPELIYDGFRSASTLTDDDIGLVVDTRRGEDVTIQRLPEAVPVEPMDDEPVPAEGRRKRRRVAAA